MNEKEIEIIQKSSALFLVNGIKSLTMNDISSKLGISKKTLYTYVSDKKDLVKKCIQLHIDANECSMKDAVSSSGNAIEELITMSKVAGKVMNEIHPSIIYDLQKYHPEAWKLVRDFEDHTILELTKQNLVKGIEQGIYRKEINIDIIAMLYVTVVQTIITNAGKNQDGTSISTQYFEVFNYHIRGIANHKGIELINQYLN